MVSDGRIAKRVPAVSKEVIIMRSSMKKLLAIVLSVLMIATTMPFSAFTATAEDDAAVTAYNNAVSAYTTAMNGTVYTNMGTAYAAYVDANEAYDAYVYGLGTSSALTTATNALVTATNNLTAWTRSTATASVYSRDSNTAIGSNYAKNILYADRQDTLIDENSNNTKNVRVQIQYGANNVLMYDGTNDILFPVAVFYFYDQSGFSNRKMYTMYPYKDGQTGSWDASNFPDDNDDFRLQGSWNGKMDYGTADWNYAYQQSDRIPGYQKSDGSAPANAPDGNRNKWNYFANYMKYVGGASGFTSGLKTLNVDWFAFTGQSSSSNRVAHTLDNAGNIYIIDYATPLAAINTKTYLAQVGSYKCNGLADYFNAYDALTVNLASYDYGSNPGTTAANVASSLATAAATVNATTSPDGDAGYNALRAAITATKATYAEGNDDNYYNSNLWATFKSAYEDARSNMTNLTTSGYSTNAAAQTLADRLNTAYNNLVNSVQNVDTTALEAAIDDAEYAIANSAYFTSASLTNADLQNVVNNAKIAVWTSVDKYKSLRAKSQTTEAIVNAQLAAVQAAVLKLVINKDYGTPAAGGYSATTVVAHAQDTSVYTPTDYANWNTVEAAITNVTTFDPAITVYVTDCAKTEIEAYIDVVRSVVVALNDLKDAFSKMDNGQLITEGTMQNAVSIEGTPETSGAGVTWRTNFWGYDNSIVFRTTHAADYLTLPDSYFSFYDGTDNNSCYGALDTMNIDDTCEWTNQITSGGNGDNESVSNDMINQYGFAGGFVAQNDGTNAKSGRLVLGKVDGRPGTGVFANASQLSTARYNVYAVKSDGQWITTAATDASDNYYVDTVDDENYYQTDLTQMLTDFDNKDETSNDGNHGAWGALYAQKGTTHFKSSTSLYVVQENSNTLTKNTKLSIDNYTFTNKNFGATYFWKYNSAGTFGYTYHGYRHDYTQYSRTVQVVNVADLFRLINQVENAGYVESNYTTASWSAYTNALAAAKADMDYSGKTAEWVLQQCQTRYDNLWAAKEALVQAADRTALINARDAVKDVYDAGQQSETYGGPWSDESWTAFANYYQNEVIAKLNGIYSATGVRDYAYYATGSTSVKSDAQQDIEARAVQVVALKDALQSNADFTPLDNAVEALRNKVTGGQFTTASIAATKTALQAVDYFWYTDAQRKAVYASAAADQAIAAAAAAVTAAGNLLVAVDDDVVNNADDLAGATANILAESNKDPDAYDYDAVQAAIAALSATTTGAEVFVDNSYYGNLTTTGYTWQHLSELEAIVTDSLTQNYKTYSVTITGVDDAASTTFTYTVGGQKYTVTGATLNDIPYGTSVKFTAPGNKYVNWYYTYSSATSSNTKEKYLTNDKEINFIVNGNITFRLDNETDVSQAGKYKVTYANNLRNTSYKIEYVNAGALELPEAPAIANYTFTGYTVDGVNYAVGASVDISKNTLVIANYNYSSSAFDFSIFNMSGDINGTGNFTAEYNQKIEITLEGLRATTPYVTVDGEQVKIAARNKNYKNSSIYAFTVVRGDVALDAYDTYAENRGTPAGAPELEGIETILAYGDSYTFYASETMYIIPYTQEEFEYAHGTATGEDDDKTCYIDVDYVDANGATAFASPSIINAGTKLSIVSNYVLPANCTLVEAGLIMKATKDGTIPTNDLTFKTVGTNGIVRMKSSQHTVGNQFVISPIQITTSIKGKTINAKYVAYVTYEDASGAQHTVLSAPQTASVIA